MQEFDQGVEQSNGASDADEAGCDGFHQNKFPPNKKGGKTAAADERDGQEKAVHKISLGNRSQTDFVRKHEIKEMSIFNWQNSLQANPFP